MKLKSWLVAISTLILLLLVLFLIMTNNKVMSIVNPEQNNNTNNLSGQTSNQNNPDNNSTNIVDRFYIPSSDYVINNINWSKYPNLQKGYVLAAYKAGPNDVLNYEFIEVQICTEIKNTDNETLIKEQLAGVAHEAKTLYGPVSGITIAGTKGGAAEYFAEILPYNDTVHLP